MAVVEIIRSWCWWRWWYVGWQWWLGAPSGTAVLLWRPLTTIQSVVRFILPEIYPLSYLVIVSLPLLVGGDKWYISLFPVEAVEWLELSILSISGGPSAGCGSEGDTQERREAAGPVTGQARVTWHQPSPTTASHYTLRQTKPVFIYSNLIF